MKHADDIRYSTYAYCLHSKDGKGTSATTLVEQSIEDACRNGKLETKVLLCDYEDEIIKVLVDYLKSLQYRVTWLSNKGIHISWAFTDRP